MNRQPVLSVRDLRVHFPIPSTNPLDRTPRYVRAVDGVSFDLYPGETLGLVGESGCGKSTTARSVIGLAPVTSGEILLHRGPDAGEPVRLNQLGPNRMFAYRRDIQMVFQDPFASLNPRMTVGAIIGEPLQVHKLASGQQLKLEIMRLMHLVGLNPRFLNRYPHEFSGGQRQRIGIARALAVRPRVILCDEPVSALDVSIQAQVVNLLMDLQEKLGIAFLFIAHDLGIVRLIADRVGVMYLGRMVETATSQDLYNNPRHPYTRSLLSAVPTPDPRARDLESRIRLEGEVPRPDEEHLGCSFAPRCPIARERCSQESPALPMMTEDHPAACFYPAEDDSQQNPVSSK